MVSGFPRDVAAGILQRDMTCAMHGTHPECRGRAEVANHRAGRGMGGSPAANVAPNGVGLCHPCNGLIESDAELAEVARRRGVKVTGLEHVQRVAVWSPSWRQFLLLTSWGAFPTGETRADLDVRELVPVPTGFRLVPRTGADLTGREVWDD